jgi:hypothetical protein
VHPEVVRGWPAGALSDIIAALVPRDGMAYHAPLVEAHARDGTTLTTGSGQP